MNNLDEDLLDGELDRIIRDIIRDGDRIIRDSEDDEDHECMCSDIADALCDFRRKWRELR